MVNQYQQDTLIEMSLLVIKYSFFSWRIILL
jgi:hypothetical protein